MNIKQITKKVYMSMPEERRDRPIVGIINGMKGVVYFDAGSSQRHAQEIITNAEKLGLSSPSYLIISHSHTDHWFGLIEYQAPSISSRTCKKRTEELARNDWGKTAYEKQVQEGHGSSFLAEILDEEYGKDRSFIALRTPEISFEDQLEIDLGDVTIHCQKINTNHSDDAIVMHIPEEKVLFLGDCLYLRTKSQTDVKKLFEQINPFNAEIFIDSHCPKIMNREEVEAYCMDYVKSLEE